MRRSRFSSRRAASAELSPYVVTRDRVGDGCATPARPPRHNDGMCGRYTVAVDPQLLAERFNVALPDDIEPRYNVAPTEPCSR